MANQLTTDAGVVTIPGAYVTTKVQTSTSGLATTGVIALVGEADAGADYSLEDDLGANTFGPDELAEVLAKYKSGPLVNDFMAASVPANDQNITGSPQKFILVKTNQSTKASMALDAVGGGDYGTLYDKSYGRFGSLIYFTVSAKTSEVKPTTGAFTYICPVGTVNLAFRANGDSAQNVAVSANMQPDAFVAAVDALNEIAATGGVNRNIMTFNGANTLTVAVVGNIITITRSVAWQVQPVAGDTLIIPGGSNIVGAGNANIGAYVVTASSSTSVTATKLSDAGKGGAVPGTITAPVAVGATAETANTNVSSWSPVTITLSDTDVVDGMGKTLEIADLATGTDLLSRVAKVFNSTVTVTWASTSASPKILVSASEYAAKLSVARQLDAASEEITAGGTIALKLGYHGTAATCQVVVTSTRLTTTVGAGSGDDLDLLLKDFPTLNDLAAYINAQPGYVCAVGSAAIGSYASSNLDEGTFFAGATHANYSMRLKVDAAKFFAAVSGSALVQLGNPAASAAAGLPTIMSDPTYLVGGAKGATSDANFIAAIDALEAVKTNFVVPCISRDATDDIADELTDSGSTYTIETVNAYAKTHVLKMSTLKRRRNRQAVLSFRGSFAEAMAAAQNIASYRCAMTFQDVKVQTSTGTIQSQPHTLAALAAGMQAAGFYRDITAKGINCSGLVQAEGDYKESDDSDVEDALLAGLLPAKKGDPSGFVWVSDQTTYSSDDNFVFNSLQAVYISDVMALSAAQRMEKAFLGATSSEVSAAVILTAFEATLSDFLRLKLLAVSDDAPKGYKNAKVKLSGNTAVCSAELKIAGGIKFIPINFLLSQVVQTAG